MGYAGKSLRIALYAAVLALPLVVSAVLGGDDPLLATVGTRFALLGFSIICLQFVLAARSRWIERPFGLDRIYRFHKAMAITALVLLAAHPVLIAAGRQRWQLITTFGQGWPILIAKLALFLMAVIALSAWIQRAMSWSFQRWRVAHNLLAVPILILGFTHNMRVGEAGEELAMRAIAISYAFVAMSAYVYHQLMVPAMLGRRRYTVMGVSEEADGVATIRLSPPEYGKRIVNKPGQFGFLTLFRGRRLPVEEHPFTISSSPNESGELTFTIKNSGDFTSTIGRTEPGDTATVEGPFGRFSYVLHPGERDLVFVAGGIGITPLMSMIRHMRDTGSDADVLLIYGNRRERDIVFREELDAIAAGGAPKLRIVHILSTPDDRWQGLTGFLDAEKIREQCGEDAASKAYYVCGPAPMMTLVRDVLDSLGVPRRKVYWEQFSL